MKPSTKHKSIQSCSYSAFHIFVFWAVKYFLSWHIITFPFWFGKHTGQNRDLTPAFCQSLHCNPWPACNKIQSGCSLFKKWLLTAVPLMWHYLGIQNLATASLHQKYIVKWEKQCRAPFKETFAPILPPFLYLQEQLLQSVHSNSPLWSCCTLITVFECTPSHGILLHPQFVTCLYLHSFNCGINTIDREFAYIILNCNSKNKILGEYPKQICWTRSSYTEFYFWIEQLCMSVCSLGLILLLKLGMIPKIS